MNHKAELLQKIADKSVVVSIIGLGYIGLPLALRFTEKGFKVVGFDIDQSKIDHIESGQSYINYIHNETIAAAVNNGLKATTDFRQISQVDVIIICVPTSLSENKEPDLSFVRNSVQSILPFIQKGQAVSLESTTYPGTTEEELVSPFMEKDFSVGENIFILYSPEREDPGNKNYTTATIPKIVSGHTQHCLEIAENLYGSVVENVVPVSSTKVAEMTKLLENIYRAVNIGLVNEMKMVADKMGIDIFEVIEAAATKPFGFTPYYPGPGLGGHCIPIDPFYLTWKAKQSGIDTKFIELAGEINTNMPEWVIDKMKSVMNERGLDLQNAKILVLGVAYKKNVDDLREAPALEIIENLLHDNMRVDYHDPYLPKLPATRKHNLQLSSIELTAENVSKYDCILLITDHDNVDYNLLLNSGKLIIDSRGRLRGAYENVITA
jgi:UDP-N-acetyl-D-glucosamine dehydrogenase